MAFGLLEVANIAHPVFVISSAYTAYLMNAAAGRDPVRTGLLSTPVFDVLRFVVYHLVKRYYLGIEPTRARRARGCDRR